MTQKLYRVVEVTWGRDGRVEKDIGCQWKAEQAAKAEMRELAKKHSVHQYGIQKQK